MSSRPKDLPSISVVLPVRNAASTLAPCLDSILEQTFADFEVVCIDDGSSDDSAAIIEAYGGRDRRIRFLRPGRVGLVQALNLAISEARAPLVARMDADDVMLARRLEAQHDAFERGTPTLVASRVELFSDHPILAGFREYVRWQNGVCTSEEIEREIYVEAPFAHPSVMYDRGAIVDAGGYRDGDFPEDYELWLRLFARGARMLKLPEVLLRWRESEGRHSRVDPRYSREAFDRLRARYLASDRRLNDGRAVAIWGSGRKTRLRARHLLELGIKPHVYVDIDPDKIGRAIDGVEVVAPAWVAEHRPFVLIYVASHGAREEISARLERMGYRPGWDFLPVG